MIAVDSMQQWQMNDPEFLTEQQKRATRVTVGDGELSRLDLKVVR